MPTSLIVTEDIIGGGGSPSLIVSWAWICPTSIASTIETIVAGRHWRQSLRPALALSVAIAGL